MPLYEYRCLDCAGEFELLIRSGETARCPVCGGTTLERVLSQFAVNSPGLSAARLASARKRHQHSKHRQERLRHEAEEIREHMRDDYGIDPAPKRRPRS